MLEYSFASINTRQIVMHTLNSFSFSTTNIFFWTYLFPPGWDPCWVCREVCGQTWENHWWFGRYDFLFLLASLSNSNMVFCLFIISYYSFYVKHYLFPARLNCHNLSFAFFLFPPISFISLSYFLRICPSLFEREQMSFMPRSSSTRPLVKSWIMPSTTWPLCKYRLVHVCGYGFCCCRGDRVLLPWQISSLVTELVSKPWAP